MSFTFQKISTIFLKNNYHKIKALWKENFEQLFDEETCPKDEVIEIDESLFLQNLEKYLKKRKFCGTCKEKIMGEYCKLKENVEMNQEEQYIHEQYDQMIHDNDEKQNGHHYNQYYEHERQQIKHYHQHNHDYHLIQRQKYQKNIDTEEECQNGQLQTNEIIQDGNQTDQKNTSQAHPEVEHMDQDDDDEFEDEVEEEEEEEEDEDRDDFEDQQYNLIRHIKYCNKTRKISIPMELDFIEEIMEKASIDTSLIKHANTTEAAQDELLICLGQTLKEKFQSVWKNKKSEEIVKNLFLNICFRVFMAQIQGYIQIALERQGCKNSLEEYLEEDERVKEAKKVKNQKKKQKQKIKKQEKKQEEQKKQMEEELKKKQEEELKQQQKLEAKLFKKQQEELLQKQKQLEEEQKKAKQQQSKKKKKGKKGQDLLQNNPETEDKYNQSEEITEINEQKFAEASPKQKKNKLNENTNIQNLGSNCKQSTKSTLMNTADLKSNIYEAYIENDLKDNSKRNKYPNQQNVNIATPINAAAAAGVQYDQIINKDASATSQLKNQRSLDTQQISSENSKGISDRERILLMQMGWDEEQECIIEIPQTDIKHYSQNKKKYDKEREFYRKNLHEKFLTLINKTKNSK